MKVKELEKELKALVPEGFELKIKELKEDGTSADFSGNLLSLSQQFKGEIIVNIVNGGDEYELIKIFPPDHESKTWYVDTSTNFCLYDVDTLPIYVQILNTIIKFLKEK